MPLNPHLLLAAKLCKVLDAQYATLEEVAVESGVELDTVQSLANGIPIHTSIDVRHRIGKALAPHFRAHPEMYRELDVFEPPPARLLFAKARMSSRRAFQSDQRKPRGVIEIESGSDEWKAFLIRDSHGRRRRIVHIPVDEWTEEEEEKLWRWLDRRDPVMKII